jgi:hypothetical protein
MVLCQCPEEKFVKVIFLELVNFQKEQYTTLDRWFVMPAYTHRLYSTVKMTSALGSIFCIEHDRRAWYLIACTVE